MISARDIADLSFAVILSKLRFTNCSPIPGYTHLTSATIGAGPFAGEQSTIGAGTKRMTLARDVRISMVPVLPLLLLLIPLLYVVDVSWAHVYPREIKPGERFGDGHML